MVELVVYCGAVTLRMGIDRMKMQDWIKKKSSKMLRKSLLLAFRRLTSEHPTLLSGPLEPVYQRIFERELLKNGLKDNYFAVGSASNYSLMYILIRAILENEFHEILELGAGQSSRLLSELARVGRLKGRVTTIEHDPFWAEQIRAQVQHAVVVVDLGVQEDQVLESLSGRPRANGVYKLDSVEIAAPINFLLVDGPPAFDDERMHARHGCLALLDKLDQKNFVVVIDDAERAGEALLADRIEQWLVDNGRAYRRGSISSTKRQIVLAGGDYIGISYY